MHKSKVIMVSVIIAVLTFSVLTVLISTATAVQDNLLPNSGFENDLNSWSLVPGTAVYTVDSTTKHSGSYSVKGVETSPGNIGRLYQDVTNITTPGLQYRISGWIKTSNVTGAVVIGLDYISPGFYTPVGGYISEIGQVTGTTDWTYYESPTFTLPSMPTDAQSLYFLFDFNAGDGTAWFDDVALTAVSASTPSPQPSSSPAADSWYMFGHDLTGARYSTSSAPKTSQILWQAALDGPVRTSITVVGSKAYVGCFGGSVYALDASNGKTIWNYKTGGDVWSTPTFANGKVFVGSNDWSVHALNDADGSQVWSFPTGGGVFSSPTVVDNVVYVGSTDRNMYALDANTGAKIWNYTTIGEIRSSAAVVNGVVYFGCFLGDTDQGSGAFYALNAATGAIIWSSPTGDGDTYTNSSPAVVDNVVYIGSTDSNLYAFRTSDGAKLWVFNTAGSVSAAPAVYNGVVYVGSDTGDFYAINCATGTQVWSYKTSNSPIYASAAIADGVVYVGSWNDRIYAFDASLGSLLWSYDTGDSVFSSPTVTGGVMFVGSYNNNVYAFGSAFTPGNSSTTVIPTPTETSTDDVTKTVWVPPPANGAVASVVTVGAVSVGAIVMAAVSSVPATTSMAAQSGFIDKLVGKVRELLPETFKKWLEDIISSKRKLKVEEKQGSPYLPTKTEIITHLISILILTFSFAYVKVGTFNELLLILPTYIGTSLLVSLVRTYILTVYARRHGVWTEYKLWYFGVAMFLVSTLAFRAPFSSPTRRVSASKNFTPRLGCYLSIAAVLVTLGFAGLFFILMEAGFALIGGTGLAMCLITAFFETFPIKPMSGVDIFKYNKVYWAILFFGTLALYGAWLAQLF